MFVGGWCRSHNASSLGVVISNSDAMTMNASNGERVNCPWCTERFVIFPAQNAKGFVCPKCGVESSLGSLRNPSFSPHAVAITEAGSIASSENFYRHTLGFVFKDGRDDLNVASGTLVRVAAYNLIATAAHVCPSRAERIEFVSKSGITCPPERNGIVRISKTSGGPDVGVIEINDDAVSNIGVVPITLDRISDNGPGHRDLRARVIGYPAAWRSTRERFGVQQGFSALSYGCETIEPSRWLAVTEKRSLDEQVEIVMDYNDDVFEWGEKSPISGGLPTPHGMSGGGVWQRTNKVQDSEIWTAEQYKLIGVQSYWLPDQRFLVAIQIVHWLKLVRDEYPQLQDEIDSRFFRIKNLTSAES